MNVKYDPQNSVNFAFFIIMKALLLSLAVNQNWWQNSFSSVRKISCVFDRLFSFDLYITKNRCHHKFIK